MQYIPLHRAESLPVHYMFFLACIWLVLVMTADVARSAAPDASFHLVELSHVEQSVTHSVMLRDSLQKLLRRRMVSGPRGLVTTADKDCCFCLYEFIKMSTDTDETVQGSEMVTVRFKDQKETTVLSVGLPVATLLPGHLLREGSPKSMSSEVVYELRHVHHSSVDTVEKIWAICQPVEYRHHFERMLPSPNIGSFVILEARKPFDSGEMLGLVDDLGIHRGQLGDTCRQVEEIEVIVLDP